MTRLTGRRILVVEDEALIATMLAEALEDEGAVVIGPAGTVSDALTLAKLVPQAAVLDVNLHGITVDPVAEALASLGTPFLVTTGYGRSALTERFNTTVFDKPYDPEEIVIALTALFATLQGRNAVV